MKIEKYLLEQINTHVNVQPQDIVKQCYQAAYGAEHLLSDLTVAEKYFNEEYMAVEPQDMDLYELISDDICRVNMAAWKNKELPSKWLFNIFAASASAPHGSKELFLQYLEEADNVVKNNELCFTHSEWKAYLDEYMKSNMTAVHHSLQYRQSNEPSYRIVNRSFIQLIPILNEVKKHYVDNEVCLIAIDGRAASGKSTMAGQLSYILDADVIHMDDFFLPMELRTEDRFQTPGGNVHFERFIQEVLPYVKLSQSFSYRKFDCGKMSYGDEQLISNKPIRIVEGSYSCHPKFGKYADITVFFDVNREEQLERILHRDGSEMTEMFRNRWIPLEEEYFKAYKIKDEADIVISFNKEN